MSPTDQVSATFYALRLVRHNNPILKFLLSAEEDAEGVLSEDKGSPPELLEAAGIIREVLRERSAVAGPSFEEEPDWLQRALSEKIIRLAMDDISIEDYDADAGERILFAMRHQDQAPSAGTAVRAALFEVGDRVVYGEYGLGTVEAVARSQEQGEPSFQYLILLDEDQGRIPVSSTTALKEGLRRPWSLQECIDFVDDLKRNFSLESDQAFICSFLTHALMSGDVLRVSSVLKEFSYMDRYGKVGRYEYLFLNKSIERIARELTFGLNIPKAEVLKLIEFALDESTRRKHEEIEKPRLAERRELERLEAERLEAERREARRLEAERLKTERLKTERRRKQM